MLSIISSFLIALSISLQKPYNKTNSIFKKLNISIIIYIIFSILLKIYIYYILPLYIILPLTSLLFIFQIIFDYILLTIQINYITFISFIFILFGNIILLIYSFPSKDIYKYTYLSLFNIFFSLSSILYNSLLFVCLFLIYEFTKPHKFKTIYTNNNNNIKPIITNLKTSNNRSKLFIYIYISSLINSYLIIINKYYISYFIYNIFNINNNINNKIEIYEILINILLLLIIAILFVFKVLWFSWVVKYISSHIFLPLFQVSYIRSFIHSFIHSFINLFIHYYYYYYSLNHYLQY